MVCRFNRSAYIKSKWWAIAISIVVLIATIVTSAAGGDILVIATELAIFIVPPARIWHYLIGKKYNTVTLYNDAVVIDEGNNDFVVPKRVRAVVYSVDRLHIGKNKIEIQGNIQITVYRNNIQDGQPTQSWSYSLMREYENDGAICERLSAMERKMN